MIRSLLVVLVCATPLLSDSREEATLQRTLDSLQGDWTVQSMTIAGERYAVEPTGYRIAGDLMIETANPEEAVRLNLDVSGGGTPKMQTLDRYGDTRTGLMERRGDSILMCWVKNGHRDEPPPPPTTFKSTDKNKAVLIVLVPAKK